VSTATDTNPRSGGLPEWVEPELATLTADRFSDPGWVFERKLDGERCLSFVDSAGVRLMTRNRKEITTTFPEVASALAAQHHGDLVVDGEIVAFDGTRTRFERLQQRLGWSTPPRSCYVRCQCATTCSTCFRPRAGMSGRCRCWNANKSSRAGSASVTRCDSPTTGTATARPFTHKPAGTAGKA
jgi:ATP dependent DNA ligase-like protein